MSSIANSNNLGPLVLQSVMPSILYTPTPYMNYRNVADKASVPMHGGTTARFMRARALKPATIQINPDGIDPGLQKPQRDVIDAIMARYGTGCIINETLLVQNQDPVLAWVGDRLGVAGKQGEDLLLRDFVVSAASPIYASGGQVQDNPTNYGVSDFSNLAATLDTNNAIKFTEGLKAIDGYGSGPTRPAFYMLASCELEPDFDALTGSGFISAYNMSYPNKAIPSEFGNIFNIRILVSSENGVARGASANGRDVYYNPVLGKQALTHISQDGESMRLIYRDP